MERTFPKPGDSKAQVKVPMKILSFTSKSGATLVEVLVALVIIALVILGGGMFFFYGRVAIIREAHRRAALLVASQRLEALKAADYPEIIPEDFDPGYYHYYIVWRSNWGTLENLIEDPGDPSFSYDYVTVDSLTDQRMLTQAEYVDDDGMGDSYDYVEVTVRVEWRDSTTNTVSLTTLVAPS